MGVGKPCRHEIGDPVAVVQYRVQALGHGDDHRVAGRAGDGDDRLGAAVAGDVRAVGPVDGDAGGLDRAALHRGAHGPRDAAVGAKITRRSGAVVEKHREGGTDQLGPRHAAHVPLAAVAADGAGVDPVAAVLLEPGDGIGIHVAGEPDDLAVLEAAIRPVEADHHAAPSAGRGVAGAGFVGQRVLAGQEVKLAVGVAVMAPVASFPASGAKPFLEVSPAVPSKSTTLSR